MSWIIERLLKFTGTQKFLSAQLDITNACNLNCAHLIDDDAIVHMNWEMAAESAGIELKAYKAPAEFLSNFAKFPKDTAIYIDSELGEGIRGEDIAVDLKGKGFTNICLATGHAPEKFSHLPWLKVRGKESPWRG